MKQHPTWDTGLKLIVALWIRPSNWEGGQAGCWSHLNFSIQLWNIWAARWRHSHRSIHPQNAGLEQSRTCPNLSDQSITLIFNQPSTRGKYTFTINPGPGLAICKVADPQCVIFILNTLSLSDILVLPASYFCRTNLILVHVGTKFCALQVYW